MTHADDVVIADELRKLHGPLAGIPADCIYLGCPRVADSWPHDTVEDGLSPLEPWSVLADVAGHLQASEYTVLRWIARRELPAHRVGGDQVLRTAQ